MYSRLCSASWLWASLALIFYAQISWAQSPLLTEDFNTTTLPYSLTSVPNSWSAHSGTGTSLSATASNLTYPGLVTAGGAVTVTGGSGSREDANRPISATINSGSVYASMLLNVGTAPTTEDYFFHFMPPTGVSDFYARLFVKASGGGFQLGIIRSTGTVSYATPVLSTGTTYFIVVKYTFVAGATNDIASLFVSPTLGASEPTTPGASYSATGGEATSLSRIALRQGGNTYNVLTDYIRVGTTWESVTSGSTTLSANPTALSSFNATQGTASAAQTYALTGAGLSDPVSVSATANLELSTDGLVFSPTLVLSPTSGNLSQTVYARIAATAPSGAFNGTITNTASVTLATSVSVSGQVNAANTPILSANPTSLTSFSTAQGTASATKSFTINGQDLSPSAFTATVSSGFEISLDQSSGFTNQFTFSDLPNPFRVQVYARLTSSAAVGPASGTVVITGSNNTSTVVTLTGTVIPDPNTLVPISTARSSIRQTVTIEGRVTASTQLGGRQIYVQDATGGIAVYSGPSGTDLTSVVQLGDLFRATGPISVFNGYLEVNGVTGYTVVTGAGTVIPTPVSVTPDQLANYQGQLVTIANATITPAGSTFTGGTNYTVTSGGQSSTLRISANSPLAGAGRTNEPVSVTGIADRFVSGANTTGTNGMQLQPRILADIPNTVAAEDQLCTIPSSSVLNRDQTLDIAAWNMEFFGADGGIIDCPKGNLVYNDMGPTDEDRQQSNASIVLGKLNADIISVEEVSDINRFAAAVSNIPGSYSYVCSDRFSYYFQNECDQVPSGGTVFGPTSLAQKVCVIYNTETVTPVLAETKALFDGDYNYPTANNWSSGRLPFLFVADATINGITKRIHVVAIHAKSGSSTSGGANSDYSRRKQDIIDLKTLLDTTYPNANVVILGDYNDKLNGSIATGQESTYANFVNDPANYSPLTLPLELQNCSTFNSSASFIDHIIVSNDLNAAYVENSAYVLLPFSIPNYANTTSDHNPIVSRFDLSRLTTGGDFSITDVTSVICSTVSAGLRSLTFTPQYAGTNGQPISFSVVNEMLPTTNSAPYTLSLYIDNPTITLKATQSGTPGEASYTYNWLANCGTTSTSSLSITGLTNVNCATVSAGLRSLTFTPQYAGTNGQPISFSVVNEKLPTTDPGPYTLNLYIDNPTIILKATQAGSPEEATYVYNWLANCTSTPSAFAITGIASATCTVVTPGLRTLRFTPQYTGTTGQPISFSVVNEMLPTTEPAPYQLNLYIDNPIITLKATQSGTPDEASYVYNWLSFCNAGTRQAAQEIGDQLSVKLLGNPLSTGFVRVEVRGADNQLVRFQLSDVKGKIIADQQIQLQSPVEQHTIEVGTNSATLLLLRVSTPTQSQTVKVIRQ
ncbi:hypothetical protein GCM10028805_06090 [Spirosoma harenae]